MLVIPRGRFPFYGNHTSPHVGRAERVPNYQTSLAVIVTKRNVLSVKFSYVFVFCEANELPTREFLNTDYSYPSGSIGSNATIKAHKNSTLGVRSGKDRSLQSREKENQSGNLKLKSINWFKSSPKISG